jgi:molybdopterin/thiamine biosynthesis adenylyltransferase
MPRDYSRLETTAFSRDQMVAVRAVVVGAGALGNEVLKNLALLGVGGLLIVDRDHVEPSNLTRSIFFCIPDIERHFESRTAKAELAAQRIKETNPDVGVGFFVGEIGDFGLGRLRRANLIFGCLDNEVARMELSWACNRLNLRLVDAGLGLINSSSGMVSLFNGSDGPCYACRKGSERRSQLLQELYGREDPCWLKERRGEQQGYIATTPLMASLVGALQVETGLRSLQKKSEATVGIAYRIAIHPAPELQTLQFERSPSCPLHDPDSILSEIQEFEGAVSSEWTPARLFAELDVDACYLSLDWPITVRALCRTCSCEWRPMMRRARFRNQHCTNCGSLELTEVEVLSRIEAGSCWSEHTFLELGLPLGHIYEIVVGSGKDSRRLHAEMTGDLIRAEEAANEHLFQPGPAFSTGPSVLPDH